MDEPERMPLVEEVLEEANASMTRRAIQGRMVNAAWAARATYHALTAEQDGIRPLPDHLVLGIVNTAFVTAFNMEAE